MRLLIRWFINAVALAAAAYVVPLFIPGGITIVGEPAWLTVAITALIFGLINALLRPIVKLLTCPLIILTLGLFTLIINGLMLWLSSWIAEQFGVGFQVAGFWPAFWGALVISIVSLVLSLIFREDDDHRQQRRDRW
jgi:putative membrane protein